MRAAAWLIEQGALLDDLRRFLAPLDDHQIASAETRIADLMSRSAQTLDAGAKLETVVRKLRRIGHEGFPVVDNGQIVGLLTRRDADRAVEHGLGDLTIREVMSAGAITLHPDDPVALLEQRMVASGWGQIPVVGDDGALLGIVTRTDLIQYWARTHPAAPPVAVETVDHAQIAAVLGSSAAKLIEVVAQQAREQSVTLYMVGGGVRDLLLQRANDDIDFVVEADAIPFAESLQQRYGGMIHFYRPFGTATWLLDGVAINGGDLPESVDFATARNEFYEHPTALPTVYSSSIKPDLGRRDFTINTLAIQLSPASGRVIDYYGGLADLRAGLIRVLHSLSFVDDPTRILRAVRFERRLGFSIEARTAQLIETALPMLRRITGERLHNELTLLLREPDPAGSFVLLQTRGILTAIHPAFSIPDDLHVRLQRARNPLPDWVKPPPDPTDLDWCLLLADVPPDDLTALCDRLIFSRTLTGAILDTARLVQNLDGLGEPETKPSQVVARLTGIDDLALYAAWIITAGLPQQRIWQYANEWRTIRTIIDGHVLRARGLKSGPCYAAILSRLRAARLDGDVTTDADENRLLQTLVDEGICNDGTE